MDGMTNPVSRLNGARVPAEVVGAGGPARNVVATLAALVRETMGLFGQGGLTGSTCF
ncbi:hypothetical protein NKG95_22945 [Mesorhizobium sp. M1423]|uniref:hypothetical protein n=1 Tax=Mesorhizobium sp. M1423 TaxID=2957101 RepID=UPI0033351C4B